MVGQEEENANDCGRFSVLSLIYSTQGPRALLQNHEALRAYKMQSAQGASPVCSMLSAHRKQLEKSSPVLSNAIFLHLHLRNKKNATQYKKRSYLINSVCPCFHEIALNMISYVSLIFLTSEIYREVYGIIQRLSIYSCNLETCRG